MDFLEGGGEVVPGYVRTELKTGTRGKWKG